MRVFTNSLWLFADPFRHLGRTLDHMERDSRYINAPVWPWSLAGWLIAAMTILMFVAAWSRS
jgi:hypothetical protein